MLDRYRAEVAYAHPAAGDRLPLVHLNTVGDLLPYAYPLFRLPVEAARLVAVHNDFMAREVSAECPDAEVVRIPMAATGTKVPAAPSRLCGRGWASLPTISWWGASVC